jgi:sec-independent protein translocase protein TatA
MINSINLFLNLGGGEIIVVVLVFLMFFGAKNIPEIARGLGKGMREFKDATNDIQREIHESANKIKDQADLNKE